VLQWKVRVAGFLLAHNSLAHATGDVSLSAEDRPTIQLKVEPSNTQITPKLDTGHTQAESEEEEEEEHHDWLDGNEALKFLLAGGIAGAGECSSVPRSSTSRLSI
jgi:hypothetical protein